MRLWEAAERGDNEEIKTLLAQGANLEYIGPVSNVITGY